MKSKSVCAVSVALAFALSMMIGKDVSPQPKFPITIKAGHVCPPNFLYDTGLKKFKEIVEQGTKGDVKIEIYASSCNASYTLDHFLRKAGAQDSSTKDWICRIWITASVSSNIASLALPSCAYAA